MCVCVCVCVREREREREERKSHLKHCQSIASRERPVETRQRQSCYEASSSHNDEVPVVGVAEEEGVLVSVDQMEYGQPHHLPHK